MNQNQNQRSNSNINKMLKETESSTTTQIEANENEFELESSQWQKNPINYPPPRTPLNSIPDPSQCLLEPEPIRPPPRSSSDRFGNGNAATPRVSVRSGKLHSEPNSAQNTPARNSSRVSLGGGSSRASLGRGLVSSSVLPKGTELCTQVPHFELKHDPSFWTDHNVQVRFSSSSGMFGFQL